MGDGRLGWGRLHLFGRRMHVLPCKRCFTSGCPEIHWTSNILRTRKKWVTRPNFKYQQIEVELFYLSLRNCESPIAQKQKSATQKLRTGLRPCRREHMLLLVLYIQIHLLRNNWVWMQKRVRLPNYSCFSPWREKSHLVPKKCMKNVNEYALAKKRACSSSEVIIFQNQKIVMHL